MKHEGSTGISFQVPQIMRRSQYRCGARQILSPDPRPQCSILPTATFMSHVAAVMTILDRWNGRTSLGRASWLKVRGRGFELLASIRLEVRMDFCNER